MNRLSIKLSRTELSKLMDYFYACEEVKQDVCSEPEWTEELINIHDKVLEALGSNNPSNSGRGYKCLDCDTHSDKEEDWWVEEEFVQCVWCHSLNVEPEDIEKGVMLK